MSIEFFIDGKAVTAEAGQTIMAAAAAGGIEIPGLCGDPRISKTTSCFVCVVKDKKSGKFKNPPLRLLIISVSYHLFLSALIAAWAAANLATGTRNGEHET